MFQSRLMSIASANHKRWLVICMAWTLGAGIAHAATFYVNGNSPLANDTHAGTEDKPFMTISRAVKSLEPGDTVLIKAGTYRESVTCRASGTADRPITIAAVTGDEGKVVIKGSDVIKQWKRLSGIVWTTPWTTTLECNYPEEWVKTYAVADYGPAAKRCEMIFVAGQPLQQVLGTGLLGRGTFAVDETRHELRVALFKEGTLSEAEVAMRQKGVEIHGDHLIIRGLAVMHVANPYEVAALEVFGNDNRIERCRVEWNNLDGIRVGGQRAQIIDNIASHNGDCGMVLSIHQSLVKNNQTNENSWRFGPGWHEGGIKIIGTKPSNNLVQGHVAKYNRGAGIWFDTCAGGNRVDGCWLEGNMIAGLEFEACTEGNSATNNVIIRTRDIPNALYPQAGAAGILLYESSGVKIWNNTLVANDHFGIAFAGGQRKNGAFCGNIDIANNIFSQNGLAGISYWVWGKSAEPSILATYKSDHNFWDQPEGNVAVLPAGKASTLGELQKLWHQEEHSIAGTPQFADTAKDNYRLNSNSACIGKGAAMLDTDFDGQPRSQAKPVIGAYASGIVVSQSGGQK